MNGGCSIAMFDYRRIVAKEPTMKHSHYVVLAGYTTRLLVRVDMMYNQNKYTQMVDTLELCIVADPT